MCSSLASTSTIPLQIPVSSNVACQTDKDTHSAGTQLSLKTPGTSYRSAVTFISLHLLGMKLVMLHPIVILSPLRKNHFSFSLFKFNFWSQVYRLQCPAKMFVSGYPMQRHSSFHPRQQNSFQRAYMDLEELEEEDIFDPFISQFKSITEVFILFINFYFLWFTCRNIWLFFRWTALLAILILKYH